MTAVGCPLPAGHCHSERSEESRCLSLVISMPKYQSAERHQTIRRQTSENSILERKRDNPAAFGGIQNLSPPKGWQKESALMGRLGALLRPTWRSYAGPPQWHYNPCLLQNEEMHPFWWLAPPPSPRRGDFILRYALALFCPRLRGKSGEAG